MNAIKKEIKSVTENVIHPEEETKRQARKRQRLMPIIGTLIVGIILLAISYYLPA